MRSISAVITGVGLTLFAFSEPGAQSSRTIRQYQFESAEIGYNLLMHEVPRPVAGPDEVLVRMRAGALNRGELFRISGTSGPGRPNFDGTIPLSDGAGDVIAVGGEVTGLAVGDRVVGTFFTNWVDDDTPPTGPQTPRSGSPYGMASEIIVTTPDALVPIPDYMSYEEAAALPTTGVTAWNALFVAGDTQPGDYILFEGTGGMSIIALQLAAAYGARPIITSSSNEKLARARELGAIGTVNYRENPDWQLEVRELTDNVGVKLVLDIGGAETQGKALEALAYRGHIIFAGSVTGANLPLDVPTLLGKGLSATAVFVGTRADFVALLEFMTEHQIHPVIDRSFPFEQLPEAYEFMQNGSFMGKIVITM